MGRGEGGMDGQEEGITGRRDGWMEGRKSGSMDGWMNEWVL